MHFAARKFTPRYTTGFAVGLIVFLAAPEGVRWLHGGAVAQQTLGSIPGLPNNTAVGTVITGPTTNSVTGAPGPGETLVGGESSVVACPGQGGPQNVVGTYVAPGGSLKSTVTATGGNGGSVIGFRSSVAIGGPGCH